LAPKGPISLEWQSGTSNRWRMNSMADVITQDEQGRTYRNGVLQAHTGSPGVSGAISDMIGALAKAFAPRAITQRPQRIENAVDEASGAPQTSDLGNQF
jgi:hypothetical protein